MLTYVEAISLAGDRTKQNDDALGFQRNAAWVIDGATDYTDKPVTKTASDASWIAQAASTSLASWTYGDLREAVRNASETAANAFSYLTRGQEDIERWQLPVCSLLMLTESARGLIEGIDLGDCRVFALDADGALHVAGGKTGGVDDEVKFAAAAPDAGKPLLQRTAAIARMRELRAAMNHEGAEWTFGLQPACADHARTWTLTLKRPAHILLMTDGFSALADRYRVYEPLALLKAAIGVGLQALGQELRTFETADAGGAKHPRFKTSDDATAILLRLT